MKSIDETESDIIQRTKKIYNVYTRTMAENVCLRKALELENEQLTKSGQQKRNLIKLFNKIQNQNQSKLQSLEKENGYLQSIIEEQSRAIKDHLETIDKLENEITLLKKEVDETKKEHTTIYLPDINQNQRIQKETDFCKSNFSHPSFDSDQKGRKRKVKILPRSSQFCWPILDITVNGKNSSITNVTNFSNCKTIADRTFKSHDKKKKLYFSNEDDIVDLSIDQD